jgi:hypothetical protein
MDNQMSLVDGWGRTMTIQYWDTFFEEVYQMDRNRMIREWVHSAKAKYSVVGSGADKFAGTLELGFQVSFPWSLSVGVNVSYTTPNILLDDMNIFPGASISSDLGDSPGVQEVVVFSADVEGSEGTVVVANAHGKVTGAAGSVILRPFARLISQTGDMVTTYGESFDLKGSL